MHSAMHMKLDELAAMIRGAGRILLHRHCSRIALPQVVKVASFQYQRGAISVFFPTHVVSLSGVGTVITYKQSFVYLTRLVLGHRRRSKVQATAVAL